MANITRFSPTSDALDDLFRGFFMQPVRFEGQPDVRMKMDVTEDDKAYKVHAEIPGVKKEDIHVNIDGNQVSISAEVKNEKEVKDGEKLLRSERYTAVSPGLFRWRRMWMKVPPLRNTIMAYWN